MSDSTNVHRPEPAGLFTRQIVGVLRLELRRHLFSRRSFGILFLAFSPVALVALWALTPLPHEFYQGPSQASGFFALIFVFYLYFSIFLGALLVFMSSFRGDILERSLHFYFLTPVRREVLTAGKYLSALVVSSAAFALGTATLYLSTCLPWGLGEMGRFLFRGPGLGNLTAYVVVTVLAVAGYGAVFLLAGQYFRNPVAPAFLILLWEAFNPFLPSLLKKISVVFYLQSFYPIPPPQDHLFGWLSLLGVLEEPPPAWLSFLGLMIFIAVVISAASFRARTMEVSYGDD